jgi:N-acetylneuraminic acid mutarotase
MKSISPFAVALFILQSAACSSTNTASPSQASTSSNDAGTITDAGASQTTDADAGAIELAEMTNARSLFGAVTTASGEVRVFAGLGQLGLENSAETYDPKSNAWTSNAAAEIKRYAHATAQNADGNVLLIGGTIDGATPIATVETYSPSTDSWTKLADLPTARLGLAAATASDGRVFAIGGKGSDGQPTDVVEVYDSTSKAWTTAASLPTKRLSLSAVTGKDGRIYAIGGRDASNTPLTVVESLDPIAGTWRAEAPMSKARYWFGAARGNDDKIYVTGGIGDDGFLNAAEALTVGTGWSDLPQIPDSRAWVATAATLDGRILMIGGSSIGDAIGNTQPPPLATMLAYDIAKNAWSSAAE